MKKKINIRKLTTNGILIALGVILHQITPPFLGMQADFSLAIMFIIIVMNRDYKTTFVVGIVMGIFAALTTKTVGGQLPSIIDKFLSANFIFYSFNIPSLFIEVLTILYNTVPNTQFMAVVGITTVSISTLKAIGSPER